MLAKTRAKMTKLEQLKAAYEAATPGEWPDGSPILFEASVDGELDLYEIDGEPV